MFGHKQRPLHKHKEEQEAPNHVSRLPKTPRKISTNQAGNQPRGFSRKARHCSVRQETGTHAHRSEAHRSEAHRSEAHRRRAHRSGAHRRRARSSRKLGGFDGVSGEK